MDVLKRNIRTAIKAAKKRGTVGMSTANLRQITDTTGLTITVFQFDAAFDGLDGLAGNVAREEKFDLYVAN